MQTRSLSRLLMIVSIATDVFPVWRSPMMSSRWPRPMGIIPSIDLSPVWTGVFTGWRSTTPGALNSAGRVSEALTSPLSSSGRPSGSTRRPRSSSPTGICSSLPVRLAVSPSTILSQSPNRTTPTLSSSRFNASPVTSWGSSSISSDMQLSRPCTRAMPSATERTVPTSARSAPSVSSPSMRSRRMLAISSGLISTFVYSLCRFRDFFSQSFQLVADARVQDHVANLQHDPPEHALVDIGLQLDRLPGLVLDLLPDRVDHVRRQLDGAGQPHVEVALLLGPHLVEPGADAEDRRHPVLLREQLEEVHQLRITPRDDARDPIALLRRREVRAEQKHLQIAVFGDRIRDLGKLVVHLVELALVAGDLEQSLGVYPRNFLHYWSSELPAGDRAEKSTSFRASSISRLWSSESSVLRVTFSVASTVRSATSLRIRSSDRLVSISMSRRAAETSSSRLDRPEAAAPPASAWAASAALGARATMLSACSRASLSRSRYSPRRRSASARCFSAASMLSL